MVYWGNTIAVCAGCTQDCDIWENVTGGGKGEKYVYGECIDEVGNEGAGI